MPIMNYIRLFIVPIFIINLNGRTTSCMDYDVNQNISNKNGNKELNPQNRTNMNSRDKILLLENGINQCGLAALNQCLSTLNPGDNPILQPFQEIYSKLDDAKCRCEPEYIFANLFESTLSKCTIDYFNNNEIKQKFAENKKVFFQSGTDTSERYGSLVSLSEQMGCDISKINYYLALNPMQENKYYTSLQQLLLDEDKKNKELIEKRLHEAENEAKNKSKEFKEEQQEPKVVQSKPLDSAEQFINNNTLNLILQIDTQNVWKNLQQDIIKNNGCVKINGNIFELCSIVFRSGLTKMYGNDLYKTTRINSTSFTHFIAAKKFSNGEWVLIDSLPVGIYKYRTLNALINNVVDQQKYMPRMLCFTKKNNGPVNNINSTTQLIHNNSIKPNNILTKTVIKPNYNTIRPQTNTINTADIKIEQEIKTLEEQINQIKNEITNKKNELEDYFKIEDKVKEARDFIENDLYNNENIRTLIQRNPDKIPDTVYNFLAANNHGNLHDSMAIINNIFITKQKIAELENEFSKLSEELSNKRNQLLQNNNNINHISHDLDNLNLNNNNNKSNNSNNRFRTGNNVSNKNNINNSINELSNQIQKKTNKAGFIVQSSNNNKNNNNQKVNNKSGVQYNTGIEKITIENVNKIVSEAKFESYWNAAKKPEVNEILEILSYWFTNLNQNAMPLTFTKFNQLLQLSIQAQKCRKEILIKVSDINNNQNWDIISKYLNNFNQSNGSITGEQIAELCMKVWADVIAGLEKIEKNSKVQDAEKVMDLKTSIDNLKPFLDSLGFKFK